MVFDAQYFHMGCQGIGSSKPHASQAHFKQPKPESQPPLLFFPSPQNFAFLEWIQKREKNIVDVFAGAFQKTSADFIQLFMLLRLVLKMV